MAEFDALQFPDSQQAPDRARAGAQDFCRLPGCHKLWTFSGWRVGDGVHAFTRALYGLLLSAGNSRISFQYGRDGSSGSSSILDAVRLNSEISTIGP